ncbi:clostripain-related cysteine peptidase [Carboxydochorda subterranea]|uniref:Clostripain-related cysteine peptidase n=1 Tax=Carboxydichorda subterranea TaxID=3109565 RepID=A0ABZ1C144_9FIRM|nr:clostripain-related cysteine peptidase [Limnochorda sp. L945t]WRP18821.1 clostripain-related cysteine peptidase [Limnochorda sp. L945t]
MTRAGLVLVAGDPGRRPPSDPVTLAEFMTRSAKNDPARRHGLILWNHGAGSVVGFGADEGYGGQSLSVTGIRQALEIRRDLERAHERAGATLELIGLNGSLMSTTEVAYAVSPFARCMVAS